jgi:hypothetical protein
MLENPDVAQAQVTLLEDPAGQKDIAELLRSQRSGPERPEPRP